MKFFEKSKHENSESNANNVTLGVKVTISSKSCIDVEYKNRIARFYGELGIVGFKADATSMRWLSPRSDDVISKQERDKWISLVSQYYGNAKNRVYFVDDQGQEYHCIIS